MTNDHLSYTAVLPGPPVNILDLQQLLVGYDSKVSAGSACSASSSSWQRHSESASKVRHGVASTQHPASLAGCQGGCQRHLTAGRRPGCYYLVPLALALPGTPASQAVTCTVAHASLSCSATGIGMPVSLSG